MFFTVLNYDFYEKKPQLMKKLLIIPVAIGALACYNFDHTNRWDETPISLWQTK